MRKIRIIKRPGVVTGLGFSSRPSLNRDYRYLSRNAVARPLGSKSRKSRLMGFVLITLFAVTWLAAPFKSSDESLSLPSSENVYLQSSENELALLNEPLAGSLASQLADKLSASQLLNSAQASIMPLESADGVQNEPNSDAAPGLSPLAMILPKADMLTIEELSNFDSSLNVKSNVGGNPGELKAFQVKKGDTLSKLFGDAGLPLVTAIKLARVPEAKALKRLSPGREMRFYFDQNHQFDSLEYDINHLETIVVAPLAAGEFHVAQHKKVVKYETLTASGVINSSLSNAADNAGISLTLALALVDIFKWEIDFARDIQPGDQFRMIYQKAYVDGEIIGDGPILAAEFINNGQSIRAVRFIDDDDIAAYFTPDGASLRRGFLRTPVELARISSGFSKSRFHPVKKKWRAHKGVDYAARKGTPILATGDATVQYAGRKGGYGKTVILRHGSKYTTLYAHMTNYGRGVRSGKRVSQGQIIGYVGSTGLATGPHLHYEFRVHGKHKDPLKVKLPKAIPLEKKYMARFQGESKLLLAYLGKLVPSRVATN